MKHKEDPEKATSAIQDLLKYQKDWLVSQLRGKAFVRNTTKMHRRHLSWSIVDGVIFSWQVITGRPIEKETEIVACNIHWDIWDDVSCAYDIGTGRELRMDQILFPGPVKLLLYSKSRPDGWTVEIKGTTKEVLEKIYIEHQPILEELDGEVCFEGLREYYKGTYFVDLM